MKVWLCLALFFMVTGDLYGAEANDAAATINAVQDKFREASSQWFDPIGTIAARILIFLSIISWTWAAGQLLLRGADLQEFAVELIRLIMVTGFWLALILNANEWSRYIIDGFTWTAKAANDLVVLVGPEQPATSPADILTIGLNMSDSIVTQASWYEVPTYLSALIIAVIYALIAAYAFIAVVESYIVTAAGVLLLGFGGSAWTSDYAKRYLIYCVSIGAKLYMVFLVVHLGSAFINDWAESIDKNKSESILPLIAVVLFLLLMVKMLPDLVQSLVNGASISGFTPQSVGSSARGAVASASAVSGAVSKAGGGFAAGAVRLKEAASSASKLAAAQNMAAGADGQQTSKAGALMGAFKNDVANHARSRLGRMNQDMQMQTEKLNAAHELNGAADTSNTDKSNDGLSGGLSAGNPSYSSPSKQR